LPGPDCWFDLEHGGRENFSRRVLGTAHVLAPILVIEPKARELNFLLIDPLKQEPRSQAAFRSPVF
jgi:hypothetical protein